DPHRNAPDGPDSGRRSRKWRSCARAGRAADGPAGQPVARPGRTTGGGGQRATASAIGTSPVLKRIVRPIVRVSARTAAITAATSARETVPDAAAATSIAPVGGSRVRPLGATIVHPRSLSRRWASAAALASAYA